MMSTPELADHLRDVCGRPEEWREIDAGAEDRSGVVPGGTEIYEEVDGTEQLQLSDIEFDFGDEDADLISVALPDAEGPIFSDRPTRRARARTALTNLGRLKGLELTSMINIEGLDKPGAEPLVDLDDLVRGADIPGDDVGVFPPEGGSGATLDHFADEGEARYDEPGVLYDDEPGVHYDDEPGDRYDDDRTDDLRDALDGEIDDGLRDDFDDEAEELEPAADSMLEDVPLAERIPWLILAVILLAGIAVAAAIALSGPKIGSSDRTPKRHTSAPP
jgi:hypothetical protein